MHIDEQRKDKYVNCFHWSLVIFSLLSLLIYMRGHYRSEEISESIYRDIGLNIRGSCQVLFKRKYPCLYVKM